jgi:hypothetical protein
MDRYMDGEVNVSRRMEGEITDGEIDGRGDNNGQMNRLRHK